MLGALEYRSLALFEAAVEGVEYQLLAVFEAAEGEGEILVESGFLLAVFFEADSSTL